MKKTKELTIHRTIQTESAMKMTNEWTMPNMMIKAKQEKIRKRAAELDRQRQEQEARRLMQDSPREAASKNQAA